MARVLKGFHSFTCTPTRSYAIGMSHTCLCLPSYNWYSFTDPGAGRLSRPWYEVAQADIRTYNLPIAKPALYHTATSAPKLMTFDKQSNGRQTAVELTSNRSCNHTELAIT